jgi:hypothetical protein
MGNVEQNSDSKFSDAIDLNPNTPEKHDDRINAELDRKR